MKTGILLHVILICCLCAGCSKVENDLKFTPNPYVTPPKPPPPPPPNPADRYVVTAPYAYSPDLSFQQATDDGFGTIGGTMGDIPMTATPFHGNMDFMFVIGLPYRFSLPLDPQTGSLRLGKYSVANNKPGDLAPVTFEMPGSRYPEHISDDQSFYFSLQITAIDKEQHRISGIIDSMGWKYHIFDDYYQSEKITSKPFTIDYNYCEVTLNGIKEPMEALHTGELMEQLYLGGLKSVVADYPGNRAVTSPGSLTPFWTETLIGQYVADKGVGNFVRDYADLVLTNAKDLPPVAYALNERTRIYPVDLLTLQVAQFNSNQFINGSLEFKGKTVSNWNDANNVRFDVGSPKYTVKVNFRYLR